jgi:hypothetical protein
MLHIMSIASSSFNHHNSMKSINYEAVHLTVLMLLRLSTPLSPFFSALSSFYVPFTDAVSVSDRTASNGVMINQ